jgi:hypothetical protein
MREFVSADEMGEQHVRTARWRKRQALIAAAAAALSLAVVIALIAFAAMEKRKPSSAREFGAQGRATSPGAYIAYLIVERCEVEVEKGLDGPGGLTIRGHIRNNGPTVIVAADLRCLFPSHAGGESHIDFPLIADTRLEQLGAGPLMASSGRDFAVRVGKFPDDLSPNLLRVEVVNIRLKSR